MPVTNSLIVRLSDVHLDMASDAGTVNILRGVSLDISAGEIAAVVGPSGAGKSSLMMIVGALERATSGTVEVAGRDLGPHGEIDPLVRAGIVASLIRKGEGIEPA